MNNLTVLGAALRLTESCVFGSDEMTLALYALSTIPKEQLAVLRKVGSASFRSPFSLNDKLALFDLLVLRLVREEENVFEKTLYGDTLIRFLDELVDIKNAHAEKRL